MVVRSHLVHMPVAAPVPVTCLYLCHSYWTEVCHLMLFLAEWHQQPLVGFACRAGLWAKWAGRKSGTASGPRLLSPAGEGGHRPLSMPNSYYPTAFLAWHQSVPAATISWSMKVCEPAAVCLVLSLEWSSCFLTKPCSAGLGISMSSSVCGAAWRMVSACAILDQFFGMSAMSILFTLVLLTKSVTSVWFRAVIWPQMAHACEHSHLGCYCSLVKPSSCYLTMAVWCPHCNAIMALYSVALLHLVFRVLLVPASHRPWAVSTVFGAVPLLQLYTD